MIYLRKGNESKPFNQFLDNNYYFQLKEVDQSTEDKWEEEDKVLFNVEMLIFRASEVQHKMLQHEVEDMIVNSDEHKSKKLTDNRPVLLDTN